ncbi:MAG: tRNA pseudouridine synthase D [Phycisphaerae bacterium]|nr:tRNA pseudouridine synthase D [Phycisphaerae bacterium]
MIDPAQMHVAPPAEVPPLLPLPYLTAGVEGIGGQIKQKPSDFIVTELPLYDPAGEGTHTYFCIQKQGIDTRAAIRRVAQALGRRPRDIGYAGLKDKNAVTRQVLSVEHVDPAVVEAMSVQDVSVLWVSRHRNKLRLGHLRGNRFELKIRGVGVGHLPRAREILDTLSRRGVPNFFGPQRFGVRHNGHQLGLALLRRDNKEFIDLFLGRPDPALDYGPMLKARELYEQGKFDEARRAWPPYHRDERAALAALARDGKHKHARSAVDKHLRRFLVAALQSFLFNRVLADRLATIDTLAPGDLAYLHGRGAVFHVEDPAAEQPRADRLEISPSGPLYGFKMTWPTGEPGRVEQEVISRYGIDPAWFGQGGHHVRGDRRPLRIPLGDPTIAAGADDDGPYIEIGFDLPSGAYATVVLRELIKSEHIEHHDLNDDADGDDNLAEGGDE